MDDEFEPADAAGPPGDAGDRPSDRTSAAAESEEATSADDRTREVVSRAEEAQRAVGDGDDVPVSAPRPEPPAASGVSGVDAAVERLGSLDDLPVEAHVEVFDDAHRRLDDALAELDDEQ